MKKTIIITKLTAILLIFFTSAQAQDKKGKGINLEYLNTQVNPCEDFFEYANGGWIKKNPIPAAESRWGTFNELDNKNNILIRQILEDLASKSSLPKGSTRQKVGDFYFSGMDSLAIEKEGLNSIKPELDKINSIKDKESLLSINNINLLKNVGAIYNLYVTQDEKESTQYALYFSQGGLGLPDRDYYLKDDKRFQNIREEYKKHLIAMLGFLGQKDDVARQNAEKILAIETAMAKASMTRVQLRDPYATYNKITVEQGAKITPNFNLKKRLEELGAKNINSVIVNQPEFFRKVNNMLDSVSIADWKTYLHWHYIHKAAPYLHHAVVKENFNFYGKVLSGTPEMQPRWKRVLRTTSASLEELVGQLYVEKAFSPKAKEKALEMVGNIKLAFKDHVQKLDWMSQETKEKALIKLNSFVTKIGYPDKWKDYSALTVDRKSYVLNVLRANEWKSKEDLNKLGKPVDRSEWFMSPATINAYYNPNMNEIVFPAAILQPPFFDADADDAVNYGAIGAIIGHEFTHGFDDQGRQYDEVGNLKDWWRKEDGENFIKKAETVVKQFSSYEVLDSLYINGELTLGENIADLGGLSIAYTALQKALKDKNPGKIDGYTPQQRFFISWAQGWKLSSRDEALRQQVLTDPHSPAKYRVIGPMSNLPMFYEAFDCKPGSKMVAPETSRAKIW